MKWISDMKNPLYFSFIILAILFQSFSGIFGKYAATTLHEVTLYAIITNAFYIFSIVCLFLQAVVWQQALIYYPLSFAYPFMSLMNFVVLFSSALLFNEGITPANIIGLLLISVGITVLSHKSGGAT
jgi:multidrug transporter EmrE-like cation transporter